MVFTCWEPTIAEACCAFADVGSAVADTWCLSKRVNFKFLNSDSKFVYVVFQQI